MSSPCRLPDKRTSMIRTARFRGSTVRLSNVYGFSIVSGGCGNKYQRRKLNPSVFAGDSRGKREAGSPTRRAVISIFIRKSSPETSAHSPFRGIGC